MNRWLIILVGALPVFAPAATVTFEDVAQNTNDYWVVKQNLGWSC